MAVLEHSNCVARWTEDFVIMKYIKLVSEQSSTCCDDKGGRTLLRRIAGPDALIAMIEDLSS